MTDAQFDAAIGQIVQRDKSGLREIYDAYARQIYQVIVGIVKSPQDAEDLTADLFMRLWETASQYRPGSGHKRYITVMAKNLALDFLRKNNRLSFDIDDDEQNTVVADTQDLQKDVEEANKQLAATGYEDLENPDGLNLRYYQIEAIKAAENPSEKKKELLEEIQSKVCQLLSFPYLQEQNSLL
jgi:RNA polymerase sigma factor (sigma-70 family)